jgi:hypothetical protein
MQYDEKYCTILRIYTLCTYAVRGAESYELWEDLLGNDIGRAGFLCFSIFGTPRTHNVS